MMKKIIALALALSMALSMVAFAGYTDADEINTDLSAAVELVGALGIMQGNTDGSFNPTGTLTRAEAATILYRLSSGKSTIDASWGDANLTTLSDVKGHWSAPYVNYCAALGLLIGYEDGTFRPNNAVTGAEMAKMLLNVLGYSTEKQGYGKNWPMAVLADATNSGLLDDYEAAFTAAAPREWVAAMVANLLDVQTVSYNAYTNALVKNTKNDEPVLFGEQYGVKSEVVMARSNEKAAFDGADLAEEDYSKVGNRAKPTDIEYVIPTEMLGHNVKVYYKGATLATAEKIYSVIDVTDTLVTTADKIHFDTVNGTSYLYVNGTKTTTETDTLAYAYASLTSRREFLTLLKTATSSSKLADSREVTLVDKDGDGKYEAAFCNLINYGVVGAIDVEDETATLKDFDAATVVTIDGDESTPKWENLKFVDEVEEGDYVAYETTYTDNGLEIVISKLNPVTTTIASKSGSTFTVAGTTYKEAATTLEGWDYASDFLDGVLQANLDETVYDLYVDGKYVIFAKTNDGSVVTGLNMNLAYVIEKNSPSGTGAFAETAKVQVLLSNGDIAVYEYDAEDGVPFTGTGCVAQYALYNYVINDDGTMTFTALATDATHGASADVTDATNDGVSPAMYDRNSAVTKSYLADAGNKFYANADTILFVTYTGENGVVHEVIKASELDNDLAAANYTFGTYGYTTSTDTGLKTLVYAVVTAKSTNGLPQGNASGSKYFLATADETEVLTSTGSYYTVTGINNKGEVETLTLTKISGKVGSDIVADPVKNTLYTIRTQGDETYLKALTVNTTDAFSGSTAAWYEVAVTASTGSMVEINGALYDVDAAAVITYVYNDSSSTVTLKTSNLPSTIPFGSADEVLVKVKYSNSTYVITDMIITVTDTANDITANIIKTVNP